MPELSKRPVFLQEPQIALIFNALKAYAYTLPRYSGARANAEYLADQFLRITQPSSSLPRSDG